MGRFKLSPPKPRGATPPELRAAVAAEARQLLRRWETAHPGNCLWSGAAAVTTCRVYGLRAVLQAGTAFWQRTASMDFTTNAFGYQWWGLQHPQTRERLREGLLPEMHVWAALPSCGELVDVAAGDFPAQCQRLIGQPWELPSPPDVLWASAKTMPREADYRPDLEAIAAALTLLLGYGMDLR